VHPSFFSSALNAGVGKKNFPQGKSWRNCPGNFFGAKLSEEENHRNSKKSIPVGNFFPMALIPGRFLCRQMEP
jgi:hypothetical protein